PQRLRSTPVTSALDVDLATGRVRPNGGLAGWLTREHHRVHFVGVAGAGMSGLAALLLELGHEVSGSDKVTTQETERLQRAGLHFHLNHRPEDADDTELVIFSSAITADNPILVSARAAGKPIVRRAEALAAVMSAKRGILIVGMHGKTTTSAMAAHVLREGGLHPSHYVGAEIPILRTNAHWDARGEYFVAEGVLNVPGEHNVHNAVGVIALATELGVSFEKIAASLQKFQHARRRFEVKYASERFLLVDDYAHHPSEIRATLKTAKATRHKRVLTMFQPHRYSRTKALRKEFGRAFADADRVVVTDVYGSNEAPIPGVTGQLIADEIAAHGHPGAIYEPRLEGVHRAVGNMLE